MKSEEQIKDLLEQYKFDKERNITYPPPTMINDFIIDILKWVLDEND